MLGRGRLGLYAAKSLNELNSGTDSMDTLMDAMLYEEQQHVHHDFLAHQDQDQDQDFSG